jgi:hypothetical protein
MAEAAAKLKRSERAKLSAYRTWLSHDDRRFVSAASARFGESAWNAALDAAIAAIDVTPIHPDAIQTQKEIMAHLTAMKETPKA